MKTTTKQTFQFYLKHLKKVKIKAIIHILGVSGGVILAMIYPVLYKKIIDVMSLTTDPLAAMPELMTIIIAIIILDTVSTFSWKIAGYAGSALQAKVMANILNECFYYLHQHSFNFFNDNFTGTLVKKVNRISRAFEGIHDSITWEFLPIALRTSIAISVLFYLNWILGAILLIWATVFVTINYSFSLYKLKHYDLPKVKADSAVTGQLADTITNHSNIKLFSNQKFELKQFKKVTTDWQQKTKKSWFFSQHAEFVQSFSMITVNILLIYTAIKLWSTGQLSIGDFALIQFYLLELFRQLWDFGRNIRRLYELIADAEEMTEVLNLPIEIQNKKGAKDLEIRHGQVEFKNISFNYTDEQNIIRNLSLKIKPGEKVALIGPSGGGKSTITKLLLRLFNLNTGEILIDKQDISKATQESLRANIALVPQDPILFHRSLMDNIRYGRLDASDEAVMAAAKMAHCDEFIQTFSDKYKTLVGERGVKLSGGERQRIAIARAILSNAKILILDEATSNLDSASEQLIQDALAKLTHHKTTIVIAHRLSTIVNMDRIIVLKEGKIVEEGSHGTLIRQEGSLYARLWNLQVEGYLN